MALETTQDKTSPEPKETEAPAVEGAVAGSLPRGRIEDERAIQGARIRLPDSFTRSIADYLREAQNAKGVTRYTEADLNDLAKSCVRSIEDLLNDPNAQRQLSPLLNTLRTMNSVVASTSSGLPQAGGSLAVAPAAGPGGEISVKELEGILNSTEQGRTILTLIKGVAAVSLLMQAQKSPFETASTFAFDRLGATGRTLERFIGVDDRDRGAVLRFKIDGFDLGPTFDRMNIHELSFTSDGRFQLGFGNRRVDGLSGHFSINAKGEVRAGFFLSTKF